MKKRFLFSTIAILSLCLFSKMNVSAAYYTSTLTLPDISTVTGNSRNYAAGNNTIDMTIDKWYSSCSANPNKTQISLFSGNKQLNEIVTITKTGTSIYKNMGYYAAGSKKYHFRSTFYIGNYKQYYCGFVSNSVKMSPKA